MNILVTRTDRLGDVLMSLPSVALLRMAMPRAEIDFLCSPAVSEVIAPWCEANRIGSGLRGEYDAVLFLHAPAGLVYAMWKARKRTRVRIGMYSKAHSFLFLTAGLRQRRGRAEKSEAEYNLDLARLLLARLGVECPEGSVPPINIPATEAAVKEAEAALSAIGLSSHDRFVVFHPGMGGSALNLSVAQYAELFDEVTRRMGLPVVVTVGPVPRDREMAQGLVALRPAVRVLSGVGLPALREVFRHSALVVGPSTGPLHLAHCVGTATVGVYPPVRTQRPSRWAPYGGSGRSVVLFPDVECPARTDCLGKSCPRFYCMDETPWRELLSVKAGALLEPLGR